LPEKCCPESKRDIRRAKTNGSVLAITSEMENLRIWPTPVVSKPARVATAIRRSLIARTMPYTHQSAPKFTVVQRGARVFYNRWAYEANCPGRVVGYSYDWSWVRIKFDHLKTSRAVPIYQSGKWHLSTEPLDRETLVQSGLRGGMDHIDGNG
jgi:hypothetical protein